MGYKECPNIEGLKSTTSYKIFGIILGGIKC